MKDGPDLTYNTSGNVLIGDAFLTKVRPDGRGLEYSGFIGGSESDFGAAVAVASRHRALP